MSNFTLQVAHSLCEFNSDEWDSLSASLPFQSYRWCQLGERILADCQLTILLVRDQDKPLARATLWLVRDEPLPLPAALRTGFRYYLQNHPLLICRSPLSDSSGLILTDNSNQEAKHALITAAQNELKIQHASFLLFDFLDSAQNNWPNNFKKLIIADPGTFMEINWHDFESYLDAGDKKDRQHYKRIQNKSKEYGLELTYHHNVADIERASQLIQNVSDRFSSAPNPWMRGLLENLQMVDSTWLEVHQGGELVGCGALVRDNGVQLSTALGLAKDVPYAYFLLVYAAIQQAIEHQIKTIRFGSGAYDVKRRLGFKLEDNNHIVLTANHALSKGIMRLASWILKE